MDKEMELALYGESHKPKDEVAYARLQDAAMRSEMYYQKPLMVCYSGGKDSDTLVQLAIESGIDFEVVHSHTTADAPETVRYVRQRLYSDRLRTDRPQLLYGRTGRKVLRRHRQAIYRTDRIYRIRFRSKRRVGL